MVINHRNTSEKSPKQNKDEFVISGMSGKFPSCRNVKEYEYKLYNKICMYNDDETRWTHSSPHLPKVSGKIPDLTKFDATFFGVHKQQANNMDPQGRMLIEEAFKTFMDAGINPFSLRGSKIGVYTGSIISETESKTHFDDGVPSGFGMTGCARAMLANRISYIFGLTGPSLNCDTACSSSLTAMDLALSALEKGEIEAALVGGAHLCLHPNISRQFALLGVLSMSGNCSPFDQAADGYIRSEAIGCVFIQRKSMAKRVYATVMETLINCDGYKPEGITFPSNTVQEQLLKGVYSETSKVQASDLGYMEAHGTGTIVGDPEECKAIDSAICSQRKEPLLIGSSKSNCGHAEGASGLCAMVKVIFAFQNNVIPPNYNFTKVRKGIEAIEQGRLKVVSEPTQLPKPYVGLSSFGFGGANAHVLLKQHEKEKVAKHELSYTWPRLVTWCSRTEKNINDFFSDLESKPLNDEYLALVQSAQTGGIKGMVFRGFSVLKQEKVEVNPVVLNKSAQHYSGIKRPLVWVFSGMGSQWVGMGKSLMELPQCRQSIQRSHNTLKPSGLDLIKIITSDDPNTFNHILHSFVGIAAIQIALVDLLRELGLTPDFIIGHSVGELGCAYADNCFTAEQMILAAYYRGKVSTDMTKIKGSMAAVGLGYKDIRAMLPEAIEVACHNGADSCTISGPCEDVANFVQYLKSKNIFAKEVPCSNIAYHSRYIAQFGPELHKYLKHIIPDPKLRTNKWVSTSVPKNQWFQSASKYSSAEYHTNNLLSSVLFEEGISFLPKNALTIELAPHALLQSILKNAISDGVHIGLTQRNSNDGVLFLLNSLGRLYESGVELCLEGLYPAISWPVSRGTSSLSHLVEFEHSDDYCTYKYTDVESDSGMEKFLVQLNEDHQFLSGHEIDGRILVPATFYLECVWRTFASMKSIPNFEMCSVEFENIKFVRATTLSNKDVPKLIVVIQRGTGHFEVIESKSLVVTGIIRDIIGKPKQAAVAPDIKRNDSVSILKKDFYKELKLRGYHYSGDFQGVNMALGDGSYGEVEWKKNWVTFMDYMMQLSIIGMDSRSLMLPTRIRLLRINPQYHQSVLQSKSTAQVYANKLQKKIWAGGIEIIGLNASSVQRRKAPGEPVLEKYQFLSHFPTPVLSLEDIGRCCVQLALENQPKTKLQIVELKPKTRSAHFIISLMNAVGDLPVITGNCIIYHQIQDENAPEEVAGLTHIYPADDISDIAAYIVVVAVDDANSLQSLVVRNMDRNGFVIIRERKNFRIDELNLPKKFVPIAIFPAECETFVLLQQSSNVSSLDDAKILHISSSDNTFQWINKLQEMSKLHKNIILINQNEKINGLLGLVNCLRKEPETSNIRCVLINDVNAPKFDIKSPFYEKQLKLGLCINIYYKGGWGTYRHLNLATEYAVAKHSNHVYGDILRIGDISSLKWLQGPLKKNEAVVKVVYSSLNFRDIMFASGRLPLEVLGMDRIDQACVFGFEYSGIDIKTGKPVMGMVIKSAVSSDLAEQSLLTWEIPQNWSLREAATVPVVYLTVYWAFFFTVDIRKGKSILIHAGSGGIGIAAIRVALAYGLDVFTTVSTPEKKEFLLKMFPALKENNIGNSRDTSFEEMVMERTTGNGVDYVLNSLSEDKLKASVRCLGRGGHFLEIGKFDMANDNSLELGSFLNELSFHAVLADNLFKTDEGIVQNLKQCITNDIQNGIIQPLPSTAFTAAEIVQAFKYLMSGKHIGKVLIQIREDAKSDTTLPITVLPQLYMAPDLVYIVPGGLGGFGLELVDWMILRGARKIVLSSSRGISNDYQKLRISLWKKYTCEIAINTADIGTEKGCEKLITESMKLGPIGGIFNLAVILKDSIFSNQTTDLFRQSFAPKAVATKYLDEISRKMCPKLHHFVIFSSVSCGRGNAGQTNYGMANSIMERIIEDRVSHGLPGKAIQWGAVGEVGLVAEMAAGKIDLEIGGTLQQRISSCLEVLDELMSSPDPIVSSMVVAEKKPDAAGKTPIEFVMNVLSIKDVKSISLTSTLAELGMDSLMAVEIRQTLERDFNILLNASDLRSLTLPKLTELSENHEVPTTTTNSAPVVHKDLTDNFKLLCNQIGLEAEHSPEIFDPVNQKTDGTPIIIFPGIEGNSSKVWHNIGKNLKNPAFVLQFLKISHTIDEIVQYAYQNVLDLLKHKGTKQFCIVAFSYGALVAHLTLERLEKAGYQGKTVFIDGSSIWVETFMDVMTNIYTADEMETMAVEFVLSMILPHITLQTIRHDLRNKYLTKERLDYVRSSFEKNNVENIARRMDLIESGLAKLKILQNPDTYSSIGIIDTPVFLLKPSIATITSIDDYFGLTPLARNVVQAQVLDGNHQTILHNPELANILNQLI